LYSQKTLPFLVSKAYELLSTKTFYLSQARNGLFKEYLDK